MAGVWQTMASAGPELTQLYQITRNPHCQPSLQTWASLFLPVTLPACLPACTQDGTLSMDELCLLVERMIKEQERAM
jgi:hypothetical protein